MSALLVGLLAAAPAGAGDYVTVFAAASTVDAMTEAAETFAARNGTRVRVSVAASSTLARQIENGAPADIYVSANVRWMDYLAGRGMIDVSSRADLLGNRVVLVAPAGSRLAVEMGPGFDLRRALGNGRLAMPDPDHVPAGIYGKQSLLRLGAWKAVEPRLARTRDVRAALALVSRGEAVAGVVYATDAAADPKVRVVGVFPADSHEPVVYSAAMVAGRRSPGARAFLLFLRSDAARAIFARYGFARPPPAR